MQLKVKLLKGLPLAIASNPDAISNTPPRELYKLLETLCFIKTIWVDCPMPDTPAAKQQLATASGRSAKTISRRLAALQRIGWLTGQLMRGFDAISWQALAEMYNIRHCRFYHITPVEGVPIEEIIWTKGEKEKLHQCETAYRLRTKHNPIVKQILDEVAGTANNAEAVATHQFQCFKDEGANYTDEQRCALSTHYNSKDEKILRADTALNYRAWSKLFGYKSRGGWAYRRRKQEYMGLIHVKHRVTPLPGHTTRSSRKNNRQGFVRYNISEQRLELIQPVKITVLPLKGLEGRAKQGEGAMQAFLSAPASAERSAWVKKSWITRKIKQHENKAA